MPTLIIEDGTGVDNANSYADVAYLDSYASDRGFNIPTDDADKQVFLIRAFDYLCTKLCDCVVFAPIQDALKKAQCQLVVEQQKRTLLYPKPITSSVEGFVTEKTVGPLTKKFSPVTGGRAATDQPVRIASVEVWLNKVKKEDGCECDGKGSYTYTDRVVT